MNRVRMLTSRLSLSLLVGLLLASAACRPAGDAPEAVIVLAGDQHSAYDRTAQVVGLIDRIRAEHPRVPMAVLLNGDTLEQGNAVARRSAGAIDLAMFAALASRAPTVVNLGNHEVEFDDLEGTIQSIRKTGADVVTNIGNRATGQPAAPASTVLTLNQLKAVVVGVATDDIATYRPEVRPSLALVEPVAWASSNLASLLGRAPVSIVLSHAGVRADRGILPQLPDGTLMAGAHDHVRFVHRIGRTVYVHSGAWNAYLTLAWLRRDGTGAVRWDVEQVPVAIDGPVDAALASQIRQVQETHQTAGDRAVVARRAEALAPPEAARAAVAALRQVVGVDAAFIGNTTFGGGLPAGDVSRADYDTCVRFDGTIMLAEVSGARLRALLAAANQGPDTPFEQRTGEFNYADGPASIDDAKAYRIATNDWAATNSARYFGEPAIAWTPRPGPRLKESILSVLAH